MTRTIMSESLDILGDQVLVTCGEDAVLWLAPASEAQKAHWPAEWNQARWTINDGGEPQPFGDDEDIDAAIEQWLACVQPSSDEPLVKAF